MADVLHHREIVRDEEVGDAEFLLQVDHQVDHLRLHRHVERRDRLVGHDDVRVEGERARDAEPLALTAGEFVRIVAHLRRPQAHAREQGRHAAG